MAGAFIGGNLSESERAKLADTIHKLLPKATPQQIEQFLDKADIEIGSYKKLSLPMKRELDQTLDQFDRVAKQAPHSQKSLTGWDRRIVEFWSSF